MPVIPTGLAINTATPGDRTTASGFRKALGALFKQSTPGAPTAGILYSAGGPLDVLASGTDMEYTVKAGFAVTTRTGQGAYLVGSIDDVTVPTTAADGANPRIDRIFIVQPDPELAESGVARIDVVQGTPAASPSLPALPAGALELGRKTVPAGAANTSTGDPISNKAAYTGLNVHWTQIDGVPTSFAPSAHTHTVSQITDLTTNGDVAKIGGKRITVATSAPVSPAPSVGDVWIDY